MFPSAWRVRGVPAGFDKDMLASVLRHHPLLQYPNSKTGHDGEDHGNDVQVDSLAPDLQLLEQVATVHFLTLPPPLQTLKTLMAIDILVAPNEPPTGAKRNSSSSQTITLTIDRHFYGITVLYSASDYDTDLLAISGLGSHAFGSFVHRQDGHMWLRDSVPQNIPRARVMIYGYESPLLSNNSFVNLHDLARSLRFAITRILQSAERRLVLIGHGLGGLLIKKALVEIAGLQSGAHLIDLISGVLFFGVPNDGMDTESFIPIVHDLPNRFLVESLGISSQTLAPEAKEFSRLLSWSSFEVFCFFETMLSPTAVQNSSTGEYMMTGPLRLLVSRSSATSCLPPQVRLEHSIPLHRTHSDLAKFARHDVEYEKVISVLEQILRDRDTDWENASTTSTLVESTNSVHENPVLKQAISFLLGDPELTPLFQAAVGRQDIGVGGFRRRLVGMLRSLAIDLGSEARNREEKSAAGFVRKYRLLIARAVATSVAESDLKLVKANMELHVAAAGDLASSDDKETSATSEGTQNKLDEEEVENFEGVQEKSEGEDEEGNKMDTLESTTEFSPHTDFIRSSLAFQNMVRKLADLAIPSFRSEASEFAEKLLRWKNNESGDIDEEYWDTMASRMKLVVSELCYSRPKSLWVQSYTTPSIIEIFQRKLEALTGEEWDWWPLQPPKAPLKFGELRIGWTCICGDARWEVVPQQFARHLGSLILKFPLSADPAHPAPHTSSITTYAPSSSGRGSVSAAVSNTPGNPASSNVHRTLLESPGHPKATQGAHIADQGRFIFLVANFRRHTLDEIASLHLNTTGFSSELRSVYLRLKGFWSSWFSLYGFSHCEFGRFEKYCRNGYGYRGYGLPDTTLGQYYYTPTPLEPPITPEEFRHLYRYASRLRWSKWRNVLPFCDDVVDIPTDAIDRIPQRFWNFNKQRNDREDFWGIYVCERRSAIMTALYILFCLLPFIGFCVFYSLGIVQGDIQNATTPLALALAALSLFLGSIIKQ